MAAFPAGSPVPSRRSSFKSPLQNIMADACERSLSEDLYGESEVRVGQWRKEFTLFASSEAQQGLRELCNEREHVKDLQGDLACVQGLVESAAQLRAGGIRLTEVLQSSTEAAASRAQAIALVRDDLRQQSDTHKQEVKEEERKNASQQEASDAQHVEALKLLSTYRERLGLAITRVAPQTVRMAFSLLDEQDPTREFFFTLGLSEETDQENYRVLECGPQVPELPKLVAQLNADACSVTALPRFVCSMRRAFLKASGTANVA